MMFRLKPGQAGLMVIDVQSKLLPLTHDFERVEHHVCVMVRGAEILGLPLVLTEQYPKGLGQTTEAVMEAMPSGVAPYSKTCFSCLGDPSVKEGVDRTPLDQWILVGIETHVCVQETAYDLRRHGKQVVVLADAVSSRKESNKGIALEEMRGWGVRISSVEAVLFEMLEDSTAKEFRKVMELIK